MNRDTEQDLILKAAAGCRDSASLLVKAHQQSLYAYMLRLTGRPEVAEDVVQEAFIRAITHLGRFDPRYRFSTWLFTIAKRVYMNICAKSRPAYDTDAVEAMTITIRRPAAPIEHSDSQSCMRVGLQSALMSLPFVQREVLILYHQHEWPVWLVAEHLQIPEGTVKSHLHRARIAMRQLLSAQPEYAPMLEELNAGVENGGEVP
jgi:RNA polymerase sigma-70 factor (ECF subfamily)